MQVGTPTFKIFPHFACALHTAAVVPTWKTWLNKKAAEGCMWVLPQILCFGQLGQHISCPACQGQLSSCFLNQDASKHSCKSGWKLNFFFFFKAEGSSRQVWAKDYFSLWGHTVSLTCSLLDKIQRLEVGTNAGGGQCGEALLIFSQEDLPVCYDKQDSCAGFPLHAWKWMISILAVWHFPYFMSLFGLHF